ncbi:hypothetical protein AVEN_64778-1, partial [Araneus ventricosus]
MFVSSVLSAAPWRDCPASTDAWILPSTKPPAPSSWEASNSCSLISAHQDPTSENVRKLSQSYMQESKCLNQQNTTVMDCATSMIERYPALIQRPDPESIIKVFC